MKKLLALDLSTTCTGYAVFDLETKKLLKYGHIKPNSKGLKKLSYPKQQLVKMRALAAEIVHLVLGIDDLERIAIEEINRGKNRLGQKVLDAFHFMLLDRLPDNHMDLVLYKDSDGATGWRTQLGLFLTGADKVLNKQSRNLNKKLGRGQKVPIVDRKTLACRFVNNIYGLTLDAEERESDGDEADAIGLGHSIVNRPV